MLSLLMRRNSRRETRMLTIWVQRRGEGQLAVWLAGLFQAREHDMKLLSARTSHGLAGFSRVFVINCGRRHILEAGSPGSSTPRDAIQYSKIENYLVLAASF